MKVRHASQRLAARRESGEKISTLNFQLSTEKWPMAFRYLYGFNYHRVGQGETPFYPPRPPGRETFDMLEDKTYKRNKETRIKRISWSGAAALEPRAGDESFTISEKGSRRMARNSRRESQVRAYGGCLGSQRR